MSCCCPFGVCCGVVMFGVCRLFFCCVLLFHCYVVSLSVLACLRVALLLRCCWPFWCVFVIVLFVRVVDVLFVACVVVVRWLSLLVVLFSAFARCPCWCVLLLSFRCVCLLSSLCVLVVVFLACAFCCCCFGVI